MSFIQISDLHISEKNNRRLLEACRLMKEQIDDLPVVICGDIFNFGKKIYAEDITTYHTIMYNILASNKKYIIPGNHDFVFGENTNLLRTVSDLNNNENLIIIDKITIIKIDSNLHMCFIPPTDYADTQVVNKVLDKFSLISGEKYLVVHEKIDGIKHYGEVKYARLSTNLLKKIDMTAVLAGDIHKHRVIDIGKKIVFSGSLVQKNENELENHGYVKWDYGKPTFIALNQNLASARLYHKNNSFIPSKSTDENMVAESKKITAYFKICTEDYVRMRMKELTGKYRGKISVKYLDELMSKTSISTIMDGISNDNNILSKKYHDNYIAELTDSTVSKDTLINMHSEYYSKYITNETKNRWTLDYVKWDNLYCYNGDNVIDFRYMNGLSGIVGFNGLGKTTIINIILLMLFGKPNTSIIDICNINSDKWTGYIQFTLGEFTYLIKRNGTKGVKKIDNIKLDLFKTDILLGGTVNISDRSVELTQGIIDNLIGSVDLLINTNIIPQTHESYAEFNGKKLLEAMTIGTSFGIFDAILLEVLDVIKDIKKTRNIKEKILKEKQRFIASGDMGAVLAEISDLEKQQLALCEKMDRIPKPPLGVNIRTYIFPAITLTNRDWLVEHLTNLLVNKTLSNEDIMKLISLTQKDENKPISESSLKLYISLNTKEVLNFRQELLNKNITPSEILMYNDRTDKSVATLAQLLDEETIKYDNISRLINDNILALSSLIPNPVGADDIAWLATFDGINLVDKILAKTPKKKGLLDVNNIKDYIVARTTNVKNYTDILVFSDTCECCSKNKKMFNDNSKFTYEHDEEYLYLLVLKHMDLKSKLIKLSTRRNNIRKTMMSVEYMDKNAEMCKLVNSYDNDHINYIGSSIKSYIQTLKEYKYLHEELQIFMDKVGVDKYLDIVENITANKKELATKLEKLYIRNGEIKANVHILAECSTLETEVKILQERLDIYEQYSKILNKEGIPKAMLTDYIEKLNNGINNILSNLTDFRIILTVNKDGLAIKFRNSEVNISQASGGQKFIIDVAIRLCLINLFESMPEFLIIDEGFGSLDANHLSMIQEFLRKLNKYYSEKNRWILFISHIEELQELAVNKINIDTIIRNDGKKYSTVMNISEEEGEDISGSLITICDNVSTNSPSFEDIAFVDNKYLCTYCDKNFKSKKIAENHIATKAHITMFAKKIKDSN